MRLRGLAFVLLALSCCLGLAEDAYYHVPLTSLKFSGGNLVTNLQWSVPAWQLDEALQPYAVLEGEGEALIGGETLRPWSSPETVYKNSLLAIRAPKTSLVTGKLFVTKADLTGMIALKFRIEPTFEKPDSKREFLKAKENYYRRLRERNIPGGAWFRHQEIEAAIALRVQLGGGTGNLAPEQRRSRRWENGYDSTYDLFGDGRTLSENLSLERLKPPAASNTSLVGLGDLTGIDSHGVDWKSLLHDPKPDLDPLAANIPFDQHALFFSNPDAMRRWFGEADKLAIPLCQMFELHAERASLRECYQKQLCLELNAASHLIGAEPLASIAITGSDPYLETGTDIGVVYETTSPQILKNSIQARQSAAQQGNAAVKAVRGDIAGLGYTGVVSRDRAISSFVAAVENRVLLSNSRAQLERLINVAKGKMPALASQPEYLFFRQKYPRTESLETGFLVLSDATIARWCSPQWRITNSRRIRAAAAMAELQAAHMDEFEANWSKPVSLAVDLLEIGAVSLTTNGIFSPTYGALNFLTPITELPLTEVTQAEAEAYNRWRTGYRQNWSRVLNPFAIRFSSDHQRLTAEVCVSPAIVGPEYSRLIALTSGARLGTKSADPHPEAILHFALAIDSASDPIKEAGNLLGGFVATAKANPFDWLGHCMSIYADEDPFWAELAKSNHPSDFLEQNYPRLPVAFYCEVKNPLSLAILLAAGRAFVDQKAPQMTTWENLEYNGRPYVRVTASHQPLKWGVATNLCVYYAITSDSFVLTLSESVLKRTLDRRRTLAGAPSTASQLSSTESTDAGSHVVASNNVSINPWLGTNLCLRIDQRLLPAIEALFRDELGSLRQQRLAWNNLPILNEWKRRYPQQDPVKVHEQFWHTTLVCPGGGTYVWNEQWQTMESTVYGSPAHPNPAPGKIHPFANITSANLGLTFERDNLSARIVIERDAPKSSR